MKRATISTTGPWAASWWAAHAVGEVVADDGADGRHGHDHDEVEATLPGQDAAEDDGGLAGQDRHDDVERSHGEDDEVGEGSELGERVEGDHRAPSPDGPRAPLLASMPTTLRKAFRNGHGVNPRVAGCRPDPDQRGARSRTAWRV